MSRGGGAEEPFVQAVARQVTDALSDTVGMPAQSGDAARRETALRVRRYLAAADAIAARREAATPWAERLAAEPVVLSSFFQNVDLLYDHRSPLADAVSGLILEAVHRLDRGG